MQTARANTMHASITAAVVFSRDAGHLSDNTHKSNQHMNNKFDEIAKILAQPGTRRGVFKQFGVGLLLAALGIAARAQANPRSRCGSDIQCQNAYDNTFMVCCGGRCLDPRHDESNCGACGYRCPKGKGWFCQDGLCCQQDAFGVTCYAP